MAVPQHCLRLEWASLYPARLCLGSGSSCKETGGLLGSRRLSDNWKVPVLAGHLSPAPNSQPPSAYHRRARAVPQHKGEAPAGRGRQFSILLLFSSIFLVAPSALVLPGVWKVCRLLSASLLVDSWWEKKVGV